jgi:hypothetical protein
MVRDVEHESQRPDSFPCEGTGKNDARRRYRKNLTPYNNFQTAQQFSIIYQPLAISPSVYHGLSQDILWRKLIAMNTKSGICWLDEETSSQVKLPNGRKLELDSRDDADDFVDAVGTDFISTNLTAANDVELKSAYLMMITVTQNASLEKIASGIPESELRIYIEHTRETLETLSTDRNWLRSGTVSMRHGLLLETVASFCAQTSFLKLDLSNEGMEAVAKFYASRKKNDTPNHAIAKTILILVNNALRALAQEGVNNEKRLGILEKTGLLGQFIRCVPVDSEYSASVVTFLQTCLQLVKKKFKSGTPTGDILDAVIAGEDGPINEKAKSALASLQSLARLSNNNYRYGSKPTELKKCLYCYNVETLDGANKLMKCQRCKRAHYCNRECQVAHWKSHKKMCKKVGNANISQSLYKTSETTMWAFIESNYFDIVKEVYNKTQEYGVPKKELLLEINFGGDAPALRNEFKVWLASGFLEGSSVADPPDWYRTVADRKKMARFLRGKHERVSSDHLFSVCRASNDGVVVVQPLQLLVKSYQYLSDESVEAIGREDYVRMVACLGQYTADEFFRERKSGLT